MSSVSKRGFSTDADDSVAADADPSGKVSLEHPAPRESGPQIAGGSLFDDEPEADWEVATRAGALGDAEVQALFSSTSAESVSGADMSDMDFDDAPTRVGVSVYDAEQVEIPIDVAPVEAASLADADPIVDTGIRPTAYRVFAAPREDAGQAALVAHEVKAEPARRLDSLTPLAPRRSWWARLLSSLRRVLGR